MQGWGWLDHWSCSRDRSKLCGLLDKNIVLSVESSLHVSYLLFQLLHGSEWVYLWVGHVEFFGVYRFWWGSLGSAILVSCFVEFSESFKSFGKGTSGGSAEFLVDLLLKFRI